LIWRAAVLHPLPYQIGFSFFLFRSFCHRSLLFILVLGIQFFCPHGTYRCLMTGQRALVLSFSPHFFLCFEVRFHVILFCPGVINIFDRLALHAVESLWVVAIVLFPPYFFFLSSLHHPIPPLPLPFFIGSLCL